MRCRVVRRLAAIAIVVLSGAAAVAQEALPASMEISSGWQLQDVAKVPQAGATVSAEDYQPQGWLAATVPGTVLTSMVNDGVYPEPLYGENDRESIIPESLNKTSYWYRTTFTVPKDYAHRQVWVHFDGANFTS
ncbi:MAG: glycoside hydrolase family 2, partial [Acidobacteriaceae bacterium]